ncbi:hypothetical protein ASD45_14975 [Pseudolabrys sp. Root1462]|nr:hypothetical protein ASD45_14975 [Pseudolabrys sp. Root1462]
MLGPDIDFSKIRAHRGSQDRGFEELCTQLAFLEPRATGAEFFRKGTGADAGIECFVKDRSGTETGWQAKFFFSFQSSQVQQLDESIQQALSKHPALTKFVVCLPFNLKDARRSKKHKTEWDRWREWVTHWKAEARKKYKRTLNIELWDAAGLTERLSRRDARYEGRITFWFDEAVLTQGWFRQRFEVARAGLGERYTPETNVELPIRKSVLAFCRDPFLNNFLEGWNGKIDEHATDTIDAFRRLKDTDLDAVAADLDTKADALLALLARCSPDPGTTIPVDDLVSRGAALLRSASTASSAIWKYKAQDKESDAVRSAEYYARQLYSKLHDFLDELSGENWAIANTRELLLYGDAGVGKSHLLADATSHQVERGRPALLVLGGTLRDADPWTQIIEQLGLQGISTDRLLAALDAAGQAAGCRAVVFIDAINERHGIDLWSTRLAPFLKSIGPFPHVGIVVSCRTTYLPHIVDANSELKKLHRIEHTGFAGNAAAANYYLDVRGIIRMSAPSFVPEFNNPLFLKTCCDFVILSGQKEIPRSLRGIVSIFEFYSDAVARSIQHRMKLDPSQKIVRRALAALAEAFEAGERGYTELVTAIAAMEAILPSSGLEERSLLRQLESEAVITVEPVQDDDGTLVEQVRFTFERFSDYRIASRLLERHFDKADPAASFSAGTQLRAYIEDDKAYARAGVIEAMSALVPELSGVELQDAVGATKRATYLLHEALLTSVLWRNQKHFTQRTLDLLTDASRVSGENEVLNTLIAIATEPDNQFNAHYLHGRLWKLSMPDRDKAWTTYLIDRQSDESSALGTLTSWALQNGLGNIEEGRAELAAICLSWAFTTTVRSVRDRATKALASLLSVRLHLAATLVNRFAGVNDLYVLERVLAGAYGAALQGLTTDGLATLASAAFEAIFAVDPPVQHLLIRDYARGIVELAAQKGVLPPEIDLAKARPPYKSPWPIEEVPEALIETYKQDYGKGVFSDEIVSSTVNDGDFARYIIDRAVDDWSAFPISLAGFTKEDLFKRWSDKCLSVGDEAAASLAALMDTAIELKTLEPSDPFARLRVVFVSPDDDPQEKEEDTRSPELRAAEEKRDKIEDRLRSLVGEELWADYDQQARPYLFGASREGGWWPPRFDTQHARRWVCKHAHELGWTPERFGDFERNLRSDHSRTNHSIERIGKKYQWIALYELLARIADNQMFINGYGDDPRTYNGPWQIGLRDIDPSLLASSTKDDSWRQWEPRWWMPLDLTLRSISPASRLRWLNGPDDFLRDEQLIDVADPKTGRKWTVLNEVVAWHQWAVNDGDRVLERTAWFRLQCVIVKAEDRDKLIKLLLGKLVTDEHDLPYFSLPWTSFVGEYPWHPLFEEAERSSLFTLPPTAKPVMASYRVETGGYDYSIEESFSLDLPSPELIKGLDLHLSNGRKLSYEDTSGTVRFFDPSVEEEGPSAALVDAEAFDAYLKREGMAAVWAIGGMKSVHAGSRNREGWGGERLYSTLLWREKGSFERGDHTEYRRPSTNQLRAFLAGETPEEIALIMAAQAKDAGDDFVPVKRDKAAKIASRPPLRAPKATSKMTKKTANGKSAPKALVRKKRARKKRL